jgi:hypothetical protein
VGAGQVAVASRSSASAANPEGLGGGDAVGMEAAMVSGSGRCARRGGDGVRGGGERIGGEGGGGSVSVASMAWARVAVLQALCGGEAEGTVAAEERRCRRGGDVLGFCARRAVAREASLVSKAKAAEANSPGGRRKSRRQAGLQGAMR